MRVASLLAAAAIATTSATALAAPNPFEDYDRGVKLPEPTELPDDSQTSQSDN